MKSGRMVGRNLTRRYCYRKLRPKVKNILTKKRVWEAASNVPPIMQNQPGAIEGLFFHAKFMCRCGMMRLDGYPVTAVRAVRMTIYIHKEIGNSASSTCGGIVGAHAKFLHTFLRTTFTIG